MSKKKKHHEKKSKIPPEKNSNSAYLIGKWIILRMVILGVFFIFLYWILHNDNSSDGFFSGLSKFANTHPEIFKDIVFFLGERIFWLSIMLGCIIICAIFKNYHPIEKLIPIEGYMNAPMEISKNENQNKFYSQKNPPPSR